MAAKNLFVDKFGEISTELLLNISEILVLRLPEGTGMEFQSVNNFHNKFISSLRAYNCLKVVKKIPRMRRKGLQAQFVALRVLPHKANARRTL